MSLFDRLKAIASAEWRDYVGHAFVRQLGDGSLDEASFRHYLLQDYLFLVHFARAWALAVYKSERLDDMRSASETLNGILNVEMKLHVEFCRGWGISPAEMEAAAESTACMAYTRYVLERGLAGDILDLHVALAPCVIGYGEIGAALAGSPSSRRQDNRYWPWIAMYGGPEYAAIAGAAREQLDRLGAERATPERFASLARTFRQATRLEIDFWQMGLDRS